jgi:hypothetical protein
MKKIKSDKCPDFETAVTLLVKKLRILPEYRTVIIRAVSSHKQRAQLVSYMKRSRPLFSTLPLFIRKALREYIVDIYIVAMTDVCERERKKRRPDIPKGRSDNLRPGLPAIPIALSPMTIRNMITKKESKKRNHIDAYCMLGRLLEKRKNPDAV